MTDGLSPEPPYLTIGLYLDRYTDADGLQATVDALIAAGSRPTGFSWAGPPVGDEGFEYVSDLELARGAWPVTRPGLRAYRIGFEVEDLDEVAVTYAGAKPPERHPVVLHLSAGVFGIPEEHWSTEEHGEADEYRGTVSGLLLSLVDSLDPGYAVVGIERPVPTPRRLVDGETLPTDLYVSGRVWTVDAEVPGLLREAYVDGAVREAAHGTLYSDWLLRSNAFLAPPATIGRRAAAALGHALLRMEGTLAARPS